MSGPFTVSALAITGLLMTGSAAHTAPPAHAPENTLAATTYPDPTYPITDQSVSVEPTGTERLDGSSTETLPSEGDSMINDPLPLQDIEVPQDGTRGIPEPLLAAYRNAELSAESSMPKCGLPWYLLAGIGKVESNHAANGRIDEKGTTKGTIFGPALDGTLPGNEIIKASDGSFVRAVGPMQFLPGTWAIYAADGDGDGNTDPNNVFDATLAAGKYLCSGGLDLRDPAQEMRAVLRYNNSRDYAALVLSWANAYKTGGATPVEISAAVPDSMPDGSMPEGTGSSMVVDDPAALAPPADPPVDLPADPAAPATTETPSTTPTTTVVPEPTGTATPNGTLTLQIHVLINVPGRGQIPCGIFCTPPAPGTPAPKPGPLRLPGPPPSMPFTIPALPDHKPPTTTAPEPPKTSAPATTSSAAPPTTTTTTTTPSTTPTTTPTSTAPTVEPRSQRTPSTAPGSSPTRPSPTSTSTPPPPAPAVAPPPAAAPSAQQSTPAPQQTTPQQSALAPAPQQSAPQRSAPQQSTPAPQQPPAAQSQPSRQPQPAQPSAAPPAGRQSQAPAPTTAAPKPPAAESTRPPAKPAPTTTPPPTR
ncbi:lytic transglycosylase domain-containing protein [Nocardia brasiliensis]|uniref:lytic transglycosylase domain-containing protein n=1 Tax=Nocardia brasiliensis TaxID=37326 RepID=UPI001EEC41B9|nr:lytic murein transglycosylase [Nocardia brasiliensis]